MNPRTQRFQLTGPAGAIECLRDDPAEAARGVAVITHPHPLFGGTMDNKVVQTVARAFTQGGWTAVRFNFRGVGASEVAYDEGRGEIDDMLAVVQQAAPEGALALAGFSFGGAVASQVFARLQPARAIKRLVLVAPAVTRFEVAPVPESAHEQTLVIHGEQDDTVPLQDLMDWARPQLLPVTVVPAGAHFFHGQLPLLKSLVARHLR